MPKSDGQTRFNRSFEAAPRELVALTANVRRMVAGNPGPMTFTGTCTYVVGNGEVAIIDPGPILRPRTCAPAGAAQRDDARHSRHPHPSRSFASAAALKAATGARILGCAR